VTEQQSAKSFKKDNPSTAAPPPALSTNTPTMTLFHDMLTAATRDHVDLRGIVRIITHFLQQALDLQDRARGAASASRVGHEIATQTGGISRSAAESVPSNMEPMVLIRDSSRTTRMICPSLATIERHSAALHATLRVRMCRYAPFQGTLTNVTSRTCLCRTQWQGRSPPPWNSSKRPLATRQLM
jgi:hypothetical protein